MRLPRGDQHDLRADRSRSRSRPRCRRTSSRASTGSTSARASSAATSASGSTRQPDIVLEEPDGADPRRGADPARQLGLRRLRPLGPRLRRPLRSSPQLLKSARRPLASRSTSYYGWELAAPAAAAALRASRRRRGDPARRPHREPRYTLRVRGAGARGRARRRSTQLLLVDAEGGWAGCSRSAARSTFEEKAGSKERPIKIKVKVEAHGTGSTRSSVLAATTSSSFTGRAGRGACSSRSRRRSRPRSARRSRSPDATGTRLEIGDFTFKVDLSKERLQDQGRGEEERVRDRRPATPTAFVEEALAANGDAGRVRPRR